MDEIESTIKQADNLTVSLIKKRNDQIRTIIWLCIVVIAVCVVMVLIESKVI
jgi:hypothetical protein